jgi:8-hydroxy-5-deazaflavin:NADPH oxidoreductase
MQIAIIGAGNVGTALATSFTRAGHTVTISSRDQNHAASAGATTGARVAPSAIDAVRAADIVVLAVWVDHVADVAAEIGEAAAGKTIVDVTNRISFGADGPHIDTTSSNAEAVAALFPRSSVVKAFNTLFASRQVDPIVDDIRLDAFIAGDEATAKASVVELARSIGLDPVDVGPLVRARQLEGLAFLNMTLNIANAGTWQSGWKLVGAPTGIPAAA